MKQTAVEYLIKNLEILNLIKEGDLENELFRQLELDAKEMEKHQIIKARQDGYECTYAEYGETPKCYLDGSNEQYYNETFKTQLQG